MSDQPNILSKVFVAALAIVGLLFALLVSVMVLVLQDKGQNDLILDQSEQNQHHIDCIVALAQPVIPEFCQPVKAQLIEDGIIAPDFDRSTTTTIAR